MSKLVKALKNPGYATHVVISRLLRISIREKEFAHAKEYRSATEKTNFASAISNALKNQKAFENFKRSYSYRDVLEHVSEEQGAQYLRILEARNDEILVKAIDTVLISDDIGNPIKFSFGKYTIPYISNYPTLCEACQRFKYFIWKRLRGCC